MKKHLLIISNGVLKQIYNNELTNGSALLITVLLMGLLMTLTLGISNLVIREIKMTTSIVSANQAYYGAEAGVEEALLGISQGGPGVQPSSNGRIILNLQNNSKNKQNQNKNKQVSYDFTTDNRSTRIPDFPSDRPIFVQSSYVTNAQGSKDLDCQLSSSKNRSAIPETREQIYKNCPRATFKKLALNQTNIIPLFITDTNGHTTDVNNFMVEYYMNIANGNSFTGVFAGLPLEQFDVLRWKLYGQPKIHGTGATKTESISDIYPAITNNSPSSPVCIGTDVNLTTEANEECRFPSLNYTTDSGKKISLWSAARECYSSDAGNFVTGNESIKKTSASVLGCTMKSFLASHTQNYLVLTNLVNPNVVGINNVNDLEQLSRANIYYRVIVPSVPLKNKIPRNYAEIVANGYSDNGSIVKSLQVNYRKPGFLPVFNFSLYATKQS